MPSANYNGYKTIFQARTGVWILYSKPNFVGSSRTIYPCSGRVRVPFTVRSIKPALVRNSITANTIVFTLISCINCPSGKRHKAVPRRILCQCNGFQQMDETGLSNPANTSTECDVLLSQPNDLV